MTNGRNRPDPDLLAAIAKTPVHAVAFARARDILPMLSGRRFLHGGPPIRPSDSMGPLRGALVGALLLEGTVQDRDEAEKIIAHDELDIEPCHSHGGVGALAGVVAPSTPVVLVERAGGRQAFAPVVEGLGPALRFGNFDPATLERVRWLGGQFAETMTAALEQADPIDVIDMQAEGLRRGDECHNRNVASTAGLIARLAPALSRQGAAGTRVLADLADNPHFFLCLSMSAAKAVAAEVEDHGPDGLMTAIAGNGRQSGIRVSGCDCDWIVCDAPKPTDLLLVNEASEADAAPMMGDSAITETVGLGAFALTSSLSLARSLGVDARAARSVVEEMRTITIAEHPRYLLPMDDYRGSPFGVDIRAVVDTRTPPAFDAGFAHVIPGKGRVGANLSRLPLQLFDRAAECPCGNVTEPGGP